MHTEEGRTLMWLFEQPTAEVTEDEWERVFKVNVKSIYFSAKTFMPRFIEQGQGGSVINISSTGASRPRPGLVWYNASKGAVTNVSGVSSKMESSTDCPNRLPRALLLSTAPIIFE